MQYVDIKQAIKAGGLRLVTVEAMPGARGVAAKAMIEFKSLNCVYPHYVPRVDTWNCGAGRAIPRLG
jgi:hypothetical protein